MGNGVGSQTLQKALSIVDSLPRPLVPPTHAALLAPVPRAQKEALAALDPLLCKLSKVALAEVEKPLSRAVQQLTFAPSFAAD